MQTKLCPTLAGFDGGGAARRSAAAVCPVRVLIRVGVR
jgi:hypothetical protein